MIVLADTHIRGGPGRLPTEVYSALRDADAILHAGDVVTGELLDELQTFAPVHAVLGNNDRELRGVLPDVLEIVLAEVSVAMVHDSGPRPGRAARMKRRFPDAGIVVYGHSHLPEDALGVDGQRLFNPGSPTQRWRAPARSYGSLTLGQGRVRRHRLVALPT